MEKFTVDIDKVLDDFEFNEDRALEIPSTSCINQQPVTRDVLPSQSHYTLPPSYEDSLSQNHQTYYLKGPPKNNINLYTENNSHDDLKYNDSKYYSANSQYGPPSYDSLQYNNSQSLYPTVQNTNHTSTEPSQTTEDDHGVVSSTYVLKSDELYETKNHFPHKPQQESFSTEMLKIQLFKDDTNKYNSEKKNTTQTTPSKKNSVSNVFNSLHEYINSDVVSNVVTVPAEPASKIIQNNLTYPQLLPKIDNEKATEIVHVTPPSTAAAELLEHHDNEPIIDLTDVADEADKTDTNQQDIVNDDEATDNNLVEQNEIVIAEESVNEVPTNDEHLPNEIQEIESEESSTNNINNEPVVGFDIDTVDLSDTEVDDYLKDLEDDEELEDDDVEEERQVDAILENKCDDDKTDMNTENQINEIRENMEKNVEQGETVEKNHASEEISTVEEQLTLENETNEKLVANCNQISEEIIEDSTETKEIPEKDESIVNGDLITENNNNKIDDDSTVNQESIDEENNSKTDLNPENQNNDDNENQDNVSVTENRHPKLSAICRPNSLDIVSSIDSDDQIIITQAPPGETPMPKTNVLDENVIIHAENHRNERDENASDFSPSTSEVSSIENQEGCVLDNNSRQNPATAYDNHSTLGKRPPYWIPDTDTNFCMHCGFKFTVIKRRHHCRACGLVLCSKCCNMKAKLEYLGNILSRVCIQCYDVLNKDVNSNNQQDNTSSDSANNSPAHFPNQNHANQPNPNNPMEYCSTVPPLKQIENQRPRSPPTVMVPVGVLKRQGSNKGRSEKTVMFSDGIRPGCDLTELDNSWETRPARRPTKRVSTPPGQTTTIKPNRNLPTLDQTTFSYIPANDTCLPPTVNFSKPENTYTECSNNESVVEMLRNETLVFAIQRNFNVYVKIVNLECCVNKQVWCFTTKGLSCVGQDEIVILLEVLEKEARVPKDVFLHLNTIYIDASKGNTITEMGFSIENSSNFLDSKNHAGFLYVRPTYQCLQNIILPDAPYLFGILIHRWETPWVKIFPLRLLLRLGAEYRYYPCPIISTRNRESVFVEIGHTIIKLLADFRNYSYTLPSVRGLLIHMEEKKTTVLIPKNRYDQVMRALNNSSDHILAFAGNFSKEADSHLVCIQDINGTNENGYSTHAINIQNKPRKVTGASFIILNGALKTSSGLTAKSSIIEDGLMIHILPDQMVKLRESLRNMKPFQISCGCVNSESDEHVNIVWTENDINFNIGVKSPIDNQAMDGVPSIRVHNGIDHIGSSKLIRWTEVFILQSGEENSKTQDPVDISKLSESISRATCDALVKYLELLATNNFTKVGIRVTLHSENVSYEAGSNGTKLAPIYMNELDNALIPVLHNITSKNLGNDPIVLELIFHILNS